MSAEPQIITLEPSLYAFVHRKVPVAEIGAAMGQGIAGVTAVLKTQGVTATGPWFTHHYCRPVEFFDYEICFPVAAPVTPAGEVRNGVWPAMTVACVTHEGNYDTLVASWMALERWIKAQGLTPGEEFWERYVVTAEQDPAPASWRTELNRPVSP